MNVVVVVGSLNVDLVVRAPRIPSPGETVLGDDLQQYSGGKGANQAVACARMGAKVRMVGAVGNDTFGRFLLDTLEADSIDLQFVALSDRKPSGVALITVGEDGQNAIVVSPGANSLVDATFVTRCEAAFDGASIVILQLETPLDGVIEAAKLAKARNMRVILNPAPACALPGELLTLVDDIIPNHSELALITGTTNLDDGINLLKKMGPENVVVTLGSDGAILAKEVPESEEAEATEGNHQATQKFEAIEVNVVDTTAAGDTFVGAYAVALADGDDSIRACQRGIAAGALCVSAAGAQSSIPTRAAVEALMGRTSS